MDIIPFHPSQTPPPSTSPRKCTSCNCERAIECFKSKTGRILKQCHLCRHDKRVLEPPHGQEAVSPPSKRNRNYTSPTKASLARSIDRQAPAEATLRTSALAPPPKFLLRGKDSQDDAETAAARKEQNNIRRRHRLANRSHEEHSPTPSLNTFVSASRVGAALESPRLRPLAAAPGPATFAISPAMSGSPAGPNERALRDPSLPCVMGGLAELAV